jgi:hypothetical protein
VKRSIIVLLGLSLLGCAMRPGAASSAPAERTAAAYFALRVGARWTYEIQLLGSKETKEVAMLKQNREGYFEDSNGAQFLVDSFGVRDQKRYLLRNPIEVGTSWTNVVSVSSVEHYEIVSAHERCTTRAGQWDDCVTVESRNRIEEGKTLVNQYTLAPGVGIVTLATALEAGERRIPQARLELVAFAGP